jgi:hypothetical protein
MVAHHGDRKDANTVKVLSATEDSFHEIVGGRIRTKKESAADGASGNLHHRVSRDEPKRPRHDIRVVGVPPKIVATTPRSGAAASLWHLSPPAAVSVAPDGRDQGASSSL